MGLRPELLPSGVPRVVSNSPAGAAVFSAAAVAISALAEAVASSAAVERVAAEADVADDDTLWRRRCRPVSSSSVIRTLLLVIGLTLNTGLASDFWRWCGVALAAPAPAQQQSFATPDDALTAVVQDLKSDNLSDLFRIFGPGIEPILNSGDPVADQNARERFVAYAEEHHHFDGSGDILTLVIGKDDWPFPIPLKKVDERWRFDTEAGKEEMLNRRIGENELSTIQTMWSTRRTSGHRPPRSLRRSTASTPTRTGKRSSPDRRRPTPQ